MSYPFGRVPEHEFLRRTELIEETPLSFATHRGEADTTENREEEPEQERIEQRDGDISGPAPSECVTYGPKREEPLQQRDDEDRSEIGEGVRVRGVLEKRLHPGVRE